MFLNMKLVTYIISLALAFCFYMLFSRYLIYVEVLSSGWPYIIFYGSLILFGFLSWFHFYKPKLGAILLTIVVTLMLLVWLILLLGPYLKNQYAPPFRETVISVAGSACTIALVWITKSDDDINKYLKLLLSTAPFVYVAYLLVIYSYWSI
jgi:hypothetical protein